MKFRTTGYYLREAVRNLTKNRLMAMASILTVASCIFIVAVFYCLVANIEYFLGQMEDSIGLTVFVDDALDPDDVMVLYEKIKEMPHVAAVQYISKDETLNEFVGTMFEGDEEILKSMARDNPFRRSFYIEMSDLTYQNDVRHTLEGMSEEGIAKIRHADGVSDMMLSVSTAVRVICLSLILILAAISIVIIYNTIRITVSARKNEINIMKYVGATDWFIRWPFVLEGLLIGLLGGLLPAVCCWMGYNRVIVLIQDKLPMNFVQFRPGYDIFAYLFPFAIILGIVIGVLGSGLSIRQYLKA